MVDETRNLIWTEQFRPQRLDDFVCSESYRKKFQQFIDQKSIEHIALIGPAGCGKSTMAKILAKLIPCDRMYINVSDERSIETLRTKIHDFAMHISESGLNICILDEFDGACLSPETEIITGTIENKKIVKIKDVPEIGCPIISLNIETEELENDYCIPCNNLNDLDVFEITLENENKIQCTMDHPFFIRNIKGVIQEKKLFELKKGDSIIQIL